MTTKASVTDALSSNFLMVGKPAPLLVDAAASFTMTQVPLLLTLLVIVGVRTLVGRATVMLRTGLVPLFSKN